MTFCSFCQVCHAEISTCGTFFNDSWLLRGDEGGQGAGGGGDSGHGGRTYFRIEDAASTDMEVRSYVNKYGCPGFEVVLGGDCELETTIRALKFITKVLEEEAAEVYD